MIVKAFFSPPALAVLILLSLLLWRSFTGEEARLRHRQQQFEAAQIAQGAALYHSHCRTCHGTRGEGMGQLGPTLADRHFFTARVAESGWPGSLEEFLLTAIENGRVTASRPMYATNGTTVAMPPWLARYGGPLRADQVAALVAFIENWRPTALGEVTLEELALPQTALSDPATVSRGKTIFEANCRRCHQQPPPGATRAIAPALNGIGQAAATRMPGVTAEEYLRTSVLIPLQHVVPGFEQAPETGGCSAVLGESQLTDLVGYLLSLRP